MRGTNQVKKPNGKILLNPPRNYVRLHLVSTFVAFFSSYLMLLSHLAAAEYRPGYQLHMLLPDCTGGGQRLLQSAVLACAICGTEATYGATSLSDSRYEMPRRVKEVFQVIVWSYAVPTPSLVLILRSVLIQPMVLRNCCAVPSTNAAPRTDFWH
eukprot:2196007-Rhodomonas_salina.2